MSELAPLITDLGIILVVAGCVMILFKWLKQPVILGYIVAGFITGPSFRFALVKGQRKKLPLP